MNKFALSFMVGFALLCTGCCLRLGESTRLGINCCGKKDSENFVAVDKKDGDASVAVDPQPISAKTNDVETFVGIGLAVAIAGFIGWKTFTTMKKKSDAGEKQV